MNGAVATSHPGAFRILLIEDDASLARLIGEYLGQHDFLVEIELRGDAGAKRILNDQPDLVVLDVMLPGMNGMDVCRHVRPRFTNPILMLTARDDDFDQVVGLELGADDYVKKPVEPRVLLARIRALLRRAEASTGADRNGAEPVKLSFGRLQIDRASRRVVLDKTLVELTTNEFDLLWLLACNASKVLGRETIFFQPARYRLRWTRSLGRCRRFPVAPEVARYRRSPCKNQDRARQGLPVRCRRVVVDLAGSASGRRLRPVTHGNQDATDSLVAAPYSSAPPAHAVRCSWSGEQCHIESA